LIPDWNEIAENLACRHVSAFYLFAGNQSISDQLRSFLNCFDKERLFQQSQILFKTGYIYRTISEFCLIRIAFQQDLRKFDAAMEDLIGTNVVELLLPYLIRRSSHKDVKINYKPDIAVQHFASLWEEPRKYLIDWLILVRIARQLQSDGAGKSSITKAMRACLRDGNEAQKFYASLLLKLPRPVILPQQLGVSGESLEALTDIGERFSRPRARQKQATSISKISHSSVG
jgi:hypothetical protein